MSFENRTILLAAAFWFGCGGPGSFNGTVNGTAMEVRDAVFNVAQGKPTGAITLSESEDICEEMRRRMMSVPALEMVLLNREETGTLEPGTYLILSESDARQGRPAPGPLYALVSFIGEGQSTGATGEIQLDDVSSERVSGSFNFLLTTGDQVTGAFNARPCTF